MVDHFFLTSTHNWLLFFTNKGRVYRIKAYELPEGSRDSKGQHVANLLQFAPDESIQTVLSLSLIHIFIHKPCRICPQFSGTYEPLQL